MHNTEIPVRKTFPLGAVVTGAFFVCGALLTASPGVGASINVPAATAPSGVGAVDKPAPDLPKPDEPASDHPLRVVAFGSSSTEGIGATRPGAAYPAQLQQILAGMLPRGRRVEVINRGIGGEDADSMARRLRVDVIARRPDVVIWQTGSNDPVHHVPLDRFERETREGIAAMRSAGIKVILMEPQWCPRLETIAATANYRDVIRRIGAESGIEVIRRSELMHDWIREGMLTRREMLAPDGLHMTDGGYELLARSVAPEVLKVEAIHAPVTTHTTALP